MESLRGPAKEMMTGGLEDTKEDEDTDESMRRGLTQGAKTTCELTAFQRVTAVTEKGRGQKHGGRDGMGTPKRRSLTPTDVVPLS